MRGATLSFSAALVAALSVPAFAAAVPRPPVDARSVQIQSRANSWKISDVYQGFNFYERFDFFTARDPTDGLVNYVSLSEARAKNLTHADENSFVIRGDSTKKLKVGEKRDSVRISTKKQYKQHIQIANIEHMPQGRGTWPAYWTTGNNWPFDGEIDIIEGTNDRGPNLQSLHTSPGCVMRDETRRMKGDTTHTDCNSFANGNSGCGVRGDSRRDFGPAFNKAGGGYFATVRTQTEIKMYFWSRQDPNVPDEIKAGEARDSVDPSKWGSPTSAFNSEACDLDEKFGPNMIIINLTFCGGWGGATFPGGTAACEAFVRNNPQEYDDAFWNFLWLRVYERP